MSIERAFEHCFSAVDAMASSPLDLKERRKDAYIHHLSNIDPEGDLPENLRYKLEEITKEFMQKAALEGSASIGSTIDKMDIKKAAKIADKS